MSRWCVVGVWAVSVVGLLALMPMTAWAQTKDDAIASYKKAEALLQQQKLAEAAKEYENTVRLTELVFGKDHPVVAGSLNNLAELYHDLGRYAQAEPLYRRSLDIRGTKLGKDHPLVAQSLNNLAVLYRDMGQYAKAEPLYRRSLNIWETKLGKDHPEVALSLNNLAALYHSMGQYAQAEPLYRRSLAIWEAKLGKDHPKVATTLSNLAGLYRARGEYAKAEPLYRRSLDIREAKLGKDHSDVANSLNNLATLYSDMGQFAKAEPLFRRSLEIFEAKLGKEHPDVATALNNLAMFFGEQGLWHKAVSSFDRARRIRRRFVVQVLPILAPREQQQFLANQEEAGLADALSLGLCFVDEPLVRTRSAAWLLNGKAAALEAASATGRAALLSDDPLAGKSAAELRAIRQQLARLTLQTPKAGQEAAYRERRAELTRREQDLARQLSQLGSRLERPEPWVELDELTQHLPTGSVFVDVARFKYHDYKANAGERFKPARYAAWITFPSGKVEIVDLGEAGPIDAMVAQLRKAVAAAPGAVKTEGEPDAEQQLRSVLEALAKRVLHPLLPHIGATQRWVLCPDGDLWLVPWNALPLPDAAYVVEKHTLSYVTSGRDLVTTAVRPNVKVGPPLVVADPDFGLSKQAVAAQSRQLLGAPGSDEPLRAVSLAAMLKGAVPRLPGTAAEAQAITPRLKVYAGAEPRLFLGAQALKAVVRAAKNPTALLLSTHGFFLPAPTDKQSAAGDNPLLRCGLLLAGCNDKEAPEQGVLTGLEVVGTDLRGCDLVVLSACETALGDVQQGEGVAGLRQCFQLAGADAVVATLWQVPDRQSAQQMARFFELLAQGKGKAEALAQAQREQISTRRTEFDAAHPFFWAAFTVTGEADLPSTVRGRQ